MRYNSVNYDSDSEDTAINPSKHEDVERSKTINKNQPSPRVEQW